MKNLKLFSALITVVVLLLLPSSRPRSCTERRTNYARESYTGYYSSSYTNYYSCGWFGWSRCSSTLYRRNSQTLYRAGTRYYTACCSGYTCSSNCQACCSPSCRNGGTCDTPGRCICRAGWQGSVCQSDVNECRGSNRCHRNAECRNTVGSYTCSCHTGYEGSGYSCSDINECRRSNRCHRDATCTNTVGSYSCSCNTGYQGDGYSCTDINECQVGHRCSVNSECANSIGSYRCTCNTGYEGNGFYCNDINECQRGTHSCHPQATCTNTVGDHNCNCNTGYQGNGASCRDINECLVGNGGCDQICSNDAGSYQCSCRDGYILKIDRHGCADINECATRNGGCHHNCNNTIGSYFCSCTSGYTLSNDGHTCRVPPPPPADVRVSGITTRTAVIHWRPPTIIFLNDLTRVSSFRIIASQDSFNITDVVVDVPPYQTTYTFVSTLEEFTVYTCSVLAANSFGYGEPSTAIEFKTLETTPSAPPRVTSAEAESSSLISLHWLPPPSVHINGNLKHYLVNVTESSTRRMWTFFAIDTSLRMGSLHPDYVYKFTLTAYTIGYGPYSSEVAVRTDEDAPSGWPQHLAVTNKTSNSVSLSWQPPIPSKRNGAIRSYTLLIREVETNQTFEATSNNTNTIVETLHPFYHYESRVRAETVLPGPYSDYVIVQLDEDAPSLGPTIVSANATGSSSIVLEWNPPPEHARNGIIRSYYISLEEEPTGQVFTYQTTETNSIIRSLHPYYTYKCQVHAFTVGMSPPSDPVDVTTLEDVPSGPPSNISHSASSTTLRFTWQEPAMESRNGIILAYHASIVELPEEYFVGNITTTDTEAIFDELSPHTNYEFQIAAQNSIGIGPHSATYLAKTAEDAPGESPQNVSVDDITSTEAVVMWDPPLDHTHNGIIREYLVEVTRESRNESVVYRAMATSVLVTDLHPDATYSIRVAGHTVKAGPFSSSILLRTLEDVPSAPPTNLHFDNLMPTSLTILWSPPLPDDQNGVITNYKLNFTELGTQYSTVFYTNSTWYEVMMLDPFTSYAASIAAATAVGFGPLSQHFPVRTAEDVPYSAPENFTGAAIDSTSISLQWSSPIYEDLNGILRYYQIDVIEEPTLRYFSVQTTASQYLLSSLHPFYAYIISVAASTVGNGPFSDNITIQTHPDVPSQSPSIVRWEAFSRSLFVSWDVIPPHSRNGIILGYTVLITNLDDPEAIVDSYFVESLNLTINGLSPYTTYGLLLQAQNIIGSGPTSDLHTAQTHEEAPIGSPTNVTAITFDSTSIHIYWDHPPEDTHYGFIREYRLNITELETGRKWREVVESDSTEAIITSLHPYYTYHITIVPVTIVEGSNFTEITVRTAEDEPSESPLNLVLVDVEERSFTLHWEPPRAEFVNGIIRKYIINVTDPHTGETVFHSSYNTSYAVHGLDPYTAYHVSVSAFTISAGPYTETLEIVTEEDVPTAPPENLVLHPVTSRSLLISWEPPPLHEQNGEIFDYTVLVVDEENEVIFTESQTEDLELLIKGLQPFHLYSVSLAASTFVGLGPYTFPSLIEMPEDAPSSSPSELVVLDVFSSNFTVQWTPPPADTHNGIIRSYLVNITELNTARNFVRSTAETSLVVGHLHPFYIYHITVLAVTVSHGPPTTGITVTTLETEPSSPPTNVTLLSLSSTTVTLTWLPPPLHDQNGVIVEYELIVTSLSMLDFMTLTSNTTTLVITDLIPYSEYEVTIAALTRAGSGPHTESFIFQTEQDAPSVAPENLIALHVLSRSASLRWSSLESEDLNGELTHYNMEIREEETNSLSHRTFTTTEVMIDSLHPFYTYRIRVSAVTVLPGPYTTEIVIKTLEDAPSLPPTNIRAEATSATSLLISWDPPTVEARNGIIRWYSIPITAEQSWENYSLVHTANETELNVTGLSPFISYLIQINAHTILPGPFSRTFSVTTHESAPSLPPYNVSTSILDSSLVEVTWLPPAIEGRNGIIRSYRIVIDEYGASNASSESIEDSSPVNLNLHPFYQYELKVAAVTIELGPFSETISWMMPENAPSSAPTNITITAVTSKELSVTWAPLALSEQNGVIRKYIITLLETYSGAVVDISVEGNTTSYDFQDLHPAYTYELKMAAFTVSQGPYSDVITVEMDEDIPSAAPSSIAEHVVNSTSILLFWEPLPDVEQNGEIIHYTLVLLGNESRDDLVNYNFTVNSTSTELSTRPFSEYNVSIAASTKIGIGPFSAPYTFHTPEDAPSSAPTIISVDLVTSTSCVIKWASPPRHQINGYIRHFILNVTEEKTSTIFSVRVYRLNKHLSGLHPYYNYTLSVAVMTISLGPYSQPFTFQTEEAAPSAPPTSISILEVGSHYVNISWRPPQSQHQNGIIRLYQVSLELRTSQSTDIQNFTTSSSKITLTELLPYHNYSFTVLSFTIEPGPRSEAHLFQTMEDSPNGTPLSFVAKSISSREFVLSWMAPEPMARNGILRKYILSVSETDSNLLHEEIEIDANYNNKTISSLVPNTQYSCSIAAVTIGKGPLAVIQVTTSEEAPGQPPDSVSATVLDAHTINVSWQPPLSQQNGVIRMYLLNISIAKSGVITQYSVNNTSVLLQDLVPYTTYFLQVAAVTIAVGPYSLNTYSVTPEAAPYTSPQNITAISLEPNSIALSWLPPHSDVNGVLRYYHVLVRDLSGIRVYDTLLDEDSLEVNVSGLQAYSEYNCSVAAVTVGDGPPATVQVQTLQDVPSAPPTAVSSEASNTSIQLSWQPPPQHKRNGVIILYHVILYMLATNESQKLETAENFVHLKNLHPFYLYEMIVAAETSIGIGPYSQPVLQQLPEAKPSLSVGNVEVSILSSTSVNITWLPPPREHWNGILTSYTVISHSYGPNNISLSGVSEVQLANTTLVGSASKEYPMEGGTWVNYPDPRFTFTDLVPEELTIDSLHEFFTYKFVVYLSNSVGDSAAVSSATVQLPGTAPAGPPTEIEVTAISSTSITVSWRPPPLLDQNGVISAYTASLFQLDSGRSQEYVFESLSCWLYCVIENLEPSTTYLINLAATSDYGTGPHSENVLVQTFEDMPSPPVNVSVRTISSDEILVVWDPPIHKNGIITQYQVMYYADKTKILYSTTNSLSFVFANLPGKQYTVKIRAATAVGFGNYSSEVSIEFPEDLAQGLSSSDSTSAHSYVGWVIAIVLFIVLIAISFALVVLCKKYRHKKQPQYTLNLSEWKRNPLYEDADAIEESIRTGERQVSNF